MKTLFHGRGGARARSGLAALAVAAAVFVLGCANATGSGTSSPPAYTTYLYMTDTSNGHVYTYDPSTHEASSSFLLTTETNDAAGEIEFYKGIGYVAMGAGFSGGTGGIYYFDPSASAPSATLMPGSGLLAAEYFAFYSATKAYVSVAGSYDDDTGAVYWFNPSSPSSGLTQVDATDAGKYMQEIIVGPDNYIYVAEPLAQKVLRISPVSDTVVATLSASQGGTTGLCSGTYNTGSGVFVANTGGSIDFIPSASSALSTTVETVITSTTDHTIYPGRLVQLSNGNLAATGWTNTYLVTLSGSSASVSEIKADGASFGGNLSIAYDRSQGFFYVPHVVTWGSSSKLYVFDTTGTEQSSVSVMGGTSDNIANVAFYQD